MARRLPLPFPPPMRMKAIRRGRKCCRLRDPSKVGVVTGMYASLDRSGLNVRIGRWSGRVSDATFTKHWKLLPRTAKTTR